MDEFICLKINLILSDEWFILFKYHLISDLIFSQRNKVNKMKMNGPV